MKTLLLAALMTLPLLQTPTPDKGSKMTEAKGPFDVQMAPLANPPAEGLSSFSLDKTYHGPLEATAKGQMLSAGDPKTGNAGYVAIERISGTLDGRAGSFAVMQSATMATGTPPQLTATIVPGSGTADLSGIYGSMTIDPTGGKHTYTLYYALAK